MITALCVFMCFSLLHTFCVAFKSCLDQDKPIPGLLQLVWSLMYVWAFVYSIFLAIAVNRGNPIPGAFPW